MSDDDSNMPFCKLLNVLTLPFILGALGCSHSDAQPSVVDAEPVWSVVLSQNPVYSDTSSDFAASRRVVIVSDRVVVLIDLGSTTYVAGRPKGNYRLLSLDLSSGAVLNQQDLSDFRAPDLYATDDDHVIIGEFSLRRLNPDLTPTVEQFTETGHGRTIQISPDGRTLAHETAPGTELLDSHTLRPTGIRLTESVPTAVSANAVLTDNVHWIGQYPKDLTFVTLTDEVGQHLVFHGQCSGRPAFLDDKRILITGCGIVRILDPSGHTLGETELPSKNGDFAGVSRDGSRFVIQNSESSWGDPPRIRSERFTIYDSFKVQPIAVVNSKALPERRSWTAFSKDGHLFIAGIPGNLRLYRIP